jgi:hypothetical protein
MSSRAEGAGERKYTTVSNTPLLPFVNCASSSPVGLHVQLQRPFEQVCCRGIAVIGSSKGLHAAALTCTGCGRFRGWMPHNAFAAIADVVERFGRPDQPIDLKLNGSPGENKMKMSDYAGAMFIGPKDVAEGPTQATITEVRIGKWDKPEIHLGGGRWLSLNKGNVRNLIRAFGSDDSVAWIGQRVELTVGEVEYQGERQPSVVACGIASTSPAEEGGGDARKDDLDPTTLF